jgi:hypothetical protein
MKWLRRPARLPGPVLAMLQVPPQERVLAWGSTDRAGGTQTVVLAATDRALYVQEIGERIPWEQITKATWDEPVLSVWRLAPDGRPMPVLRVRVEESGDLPAAVRDRVTDSVMVSERREIGDGAKALFVARRLGDEVRWTVVFDAGVDFEDPARRAAAEAVLAELRTTLGI